jgi:hypothetical protein
VKILSKDTLEPIPFPDCKQYRRSRKTRLHDSNSIPRSSSAGETFAIENMLPTVNVEGFNMPSSQEILYLRSRSLDKMDDEVVMDNDILRCICAVIFSHRNVSKKEKYT